MFNKFFKNEFLQIITGGEGEGEEKIGEGGKKKIIIMMEGEGEGKEKMGKGEKEKYNHNTGGGGKGHISLCTFLI